MTASLSGITNHTNLPIFIQLINYPKPHDDILICGGYHSSILTLNFVFASTQPNLQNFHPGVNNDPCNTLQTVCALISGTACALASLPTVRGIDKVFTFYVLDFANYGILKRDENQNFEMQKRNGKCTLELLSYDVH